MQKFQSSLTRFKIKTDIIIETDTWMYSSDELFYFQWNSLFVVEIATVLGAF
jgi:hypothetical protein